MWISRVCYKMLFSDGKKNIIKGKLDIKGSTCFIEMRIVLRIRIVSYMIIIRGTYTKAVQLFKALGV